MMNNAYDIFIQAGQSNAEGSGIGPVTEENIAIIDMYALWQKQYNPEKENFGYGDWLATDACHPTPKAAKIMGQEIFRTLMEE